MPCNNRQVGCLTCKKLKRHCSLQQSASTQEDNKLVTVITEASATPVEATLLDDVAKESKEPGEGIIEDQQDTFSKVIAAEDAHPAEEETVNKELFSAVDLDVQGLEMTVNQPLEPLAPGLPEEDNLADAHEAKVAVFAGLEAPVETHENPQ